MDPTLQAAIKFIIDRIQALEEKVEQLQKEKDAAKLPTR